MRPKLWHGLNAEHWRLALVELGWPPPAATLMADALVRARPLPRWEELHEPKPLDYAAMRADYEDFKRRVLK